MPMRRKLGLIILLALSIFTMGCSIAKAVHIIAEPDVVRDGANFCHNHGLCAAAELRDQTRRSIRIGPERFHQEAGNESGLGEPDGRIEWARAEQEWRLL
jgi:hypothetical protein